MIRIFLAITATALFAGCNPPQVAPSPAGANDAVITAPNGSTIVINEPLFEPLSIKGHEQTSSHCPQKPCSFSKVEISLTTYNKAHNAAHASSVININSATDDGHGVIIRTGSVISELNIRNFDHDVLFEKNVFIDQLAISGEGTGSTPATMNASHEVSNAGLDKRCTDSNSATDLCTGYVKASINGESQLGDLAVNHILITAHGNSLDLTRKSVHTSNNNPVALGSNGDPHGIQSVVITGNNNIVTLCGRTVAHITFGDTVTGSVVHLNPGITFTETGNVQVDTTKC